ncbi:MAG: SRPBCC family protein [Planctomycetota bacterium]
MITVTSQLDHAPNDVFDVVSDLSSYTSWQSGLERIEVVSGDGATVGSRFKAKLTQGALSIEVEGSLVERRGDEFLRYRMDHDDASIEVSIEVVAAGGGGTRLTQNIALEIRSFVLKLARKQIESKLEEKARADVEGLRRVLAAS